ncbi:hypothetical protein A3Q56_02430 [Intoshia linei]|uniref:ShKT domain-containing protein n=1 Tax=Intoshia linei TaxID=1819745 RepID=A0A177B8S5_9BILA|nr:hypothetical protein A3Q56_02430 [Intoshia linei]
MMKNCPVTCGYCRNFNSIGNVRLEPYNGYDEELYTQCFDKQKCCDYKDCYDEKLKDHMYQYCAKTCGFCCYDKYEHCDIKDCTNSIKVNNMSIYCAKTCGYCGCHDIKDNCSLTDCENTDKYEIMKYCPYTCELCGCVDRGKYCDYRDCKIDALQKEMYYYCAKTCGYCCDDIYETCNIKDCSDLDKRNIMIAYCAKTCGYCSCHDDKDYCNDKYCDTSEDYLISMNCPVTCGKCDCYDKKEKCDYKKCNDKEMKIMCKRTCGYYCKKYVKQDMARDCPVSCGCRDLSDNCYQFKENCSKSSMELTMRKYCRLTCGFCGHLAVSDCKDKYDKCHHFSIYCHHKEIRIKCKKTCGLCEIKTLDSKNLKPTDVNCVDNIDNCDTFQRYCKDKKMRDRMEKYCKKTCNFCDENGTDNTNLVNDSLVLTLTKCSDDRKECNKYKKYCKTSNMMESMLKYCKYTCNLCVKNFNNLRTCYLPNIKTFGRNYNGNTINTQFFHQKTIQAILKMDENFTKLNAIEKSHNLSVRKTYKMEAVLIGAFVSFMLHLRRFISSLNGSNESTEDAVSYIINLILISQFLSHSSQFTFSNINVNFSDLGLNALNPQSVKKCEKSVKNFKSVNHFVPDGDLLKKNIKCPTLIKIKPSHDNIWNKLTNTVESVIYNHYAYESAKQKKFFEAFNNWNKCLVCDPHFKSAIYNKALCYHFGRGVSIDLKKAAQLYKQASDLDHIKSRFNLKIIKYHLRHDTIRETQNSCPIEINQDILYIPLSYLGV